MTVGVTEMSRATRAERRHPGRILHVIPAIAARYGGPSAAIVGLCRALNHAGTATLVAATDADGPERLPVELGRVATFHGIDVIFFKRVASEAYKWSPALAAWLAREAASFDLVHVHAVFSHSSIAAGRACRRHGVPYIVRPLGTLDPWSLARKRSRKQALLHLGGNDLLRGASAMHYTTGEEQRLAESAMPHLSPGYVVPIGVDDEMFAGDRRAGDDRAPYVLSLSRLDAKKGIDLLIEAFHRAAAESRWRLIVAGDGDAALVAALEAAAARGPARERIEFAGWADSARKRELLAGAALFALTSHQENFGISAAEAMASGVAVVVTPGVNLAPDVREHGTGWVAERTPESVAAALSDAMANDEERASRGRAARCFAERYRWPTVAAATRTMYEGVRAARRATAAAV